ncbi:MAG: ATP-binding protein [Anaeromicrobium sp.]|jgi:nitrogen fixation/metabolism regulation signal transduction histidine kinase|uniref:ATP-binding protein n=1 Tax=Anaeromicrobium sp. TaxID=1929132 RepID=UPI0025CE3608|nr:ATP-binding protein [Anaeromicrobium sp.]MCT4593677.1 ATP-binding protein [Anaeromicrobium sp.]
MSKLVNKKISTTNELERQLKNIEQNDLLVQVLNGMNVFVFILNENRQIIFMNKVLCKELNVSSNEILGIKPGKLVKCKYSKISEYGCGYAKECDSCAARNLVVEAIHLGESKEGNVSIISLIEGLEIKSTFSEKVKQLKLGNENYYMVALVEKSSEVEKYNMERVFFHDILNTASSLYNVIRLLRIGNDKFRENEEIQMLEVYVKNIIDDIEYQRNITHAEKDDLSPSIKDFDLGQLCEDVINFMNKDERFYQVPIKLNSFEGKKIIKTDKSLLRRILINLLKNALEANETGQGIEIQIKQEDRFYEIHVHNVEVIPEKVKKELFRKGHSTKGKGRGIGIYGSKLLLNKYLNGDVTFVSEEEIGTTFIVKIPKEVNNENTYCRR